MSNKNENAIDVSRDYITPLDIRSAIFHFDVTHISLERTGNEWEFKGLCR